MRKNLYGIQNISGSRDSIVHALLPKEKMQCNDLHVQIFRTFGWLAPLILNSQEIILPYVWGCKHVCFVMQLWLDPTFFSTHRNLLDTGLVLLTTVLENKALVLKQWNKWLMRNLSLLSNCSQLLNFHFLLLLFFTHLK